MYKGTNPSAKRSQEWIAQTLVSLMQEKPFDQITIKEIMENSKLARQTFYQVFDSKEDVLEYYMDSLFVEYLKSCQAEVVGNLCDAAKLFFKFFGQNESFIDSLAQNYLICILQKKCSEYLQDERFMNFTHAGIQNPREKAFASAFVTAGLTGLLIDWFESGKTISTEELAGLVCRITNTTAT